jgi:hypothetical protein
MRKRVLFSIGIFLLLGSIALAGPGPDRERGGQDLKVVSKLGKCFSYTAKKFGVPILKATIRIGNGSIDHGRTLYQVHADVGSLHSLGLLFRMNNHFTSVIEGETCCPVRYVKEIDQEGLLIKGKKYTQTLAFDESNQKVVVEKKGEDGKQEIPLPPGTYDPLSMFARYYLIDEFTPGQDIRLSLFDGIKLRQMIFHSKKEKVQSKLYGEVEAMRIESTTSFSTFGEKEGTIRIWFTTDGKKIPISMELGLPIGDVRFELEAIEENQEKGENQ